MARLPERIEGEGLLLRRWRVEDAELLHRAVVASVDHLRPWMQWTAAEPQTVDQRRELLAEWTRDWEQGGDVQFAVLPDGRVAGSAGLLRRRGPGVLEIGYWLHPDFVGRGHATHLARLLTGAAFTVEGIERVEIRHDVANVRSGAVPARLGFTFLREVPNAEPAPADAGTDRVWSVTREAWALVSSDA